MSRLLLLIVLIAHFLSPSPSIEKQPSPSIEISADSIPIINDTIPSEDKLLANVRLNFEFLASRIGRDMYWDSQENLLIRGENGDPDTVYLSSSWTTPRMIVYPQSVTPDNHLKIVGYESGNHYIDTHAKTAIKLMKEGGVPASITLAQGIHESAWGGSTLARKNNHFGIKCQGRGHHKYKGKRRIGETLNHCVNLHDDDADDMFFVYESAYESYLAHDQLLHRIDPDKLTGSYGYLINDIPFNEQVSKKFQKHKGAATLVHGKTYTFPYWKWWAIELKNLGYATDPKYAEKLISTISRYKLYEYDKIAIATNSVTAYSGTFRSDNPSKEGP